MVSSPNDSSAISQTVAIEMLSKYINIKYLISILIDKIINNKLIN